MDTGRATHPIACDMTDRAGHPRGADGRVRPAVRTDPRRARAHVEGVRFRLRADDGVEAWVRDLAAREKACCPFFDFTIATVGAEVQWDLWVVDDDTARAVLDEFYDVPETAEGGAQRMMDRLSGLGFEVTVRP